MKLSVVIFDLDGTILDNEDEYGAAFKKVLKSLGKNVKPKFPHTQGIGVEENWHQLIAKYKIKTDKNPEELAKETQDAYLEQLPKVTLKKGVEEFITDLRDSDITVTLATSNTWPTVSKVLTALNLEEMFDLVTTAEEAKYSKPDPDLFLLTADKLGVDPESCLVIEDSPAGIEAAHRARMKVVAIARDKEHKKTLKQAELVVFNYNQLSLQKVANL